MLKPSGRLTNIEHDTLAQKTWAIRPGEEPPAEREPASHGPATRAFAAGMRIGKYPIVRVMSTGGMGIIYEAVHPVLGSRVVIKTVRPEMAGKAAIAERFRNEALAASRIRDDRLPQIFDIDRLEDNTQYMVMELLEGEDLHQRLGDGPLAPAYAVRIMFEVLEVLHKVHKLGVIHRDITPRNIFLAHSDVLGEVPKLLDFGVAHFVDDPNTRPGELVGSPFYMALEQVQDRGSIGPWTDVFAAGIVLYELIAGVRPWATQNVIAYLTTLTEQKPPRPLGAAAPAAPPGLCDAVMRAIRIEPTARYQDAAAFAHALEPFAADRSILYDPRRAAAHRPSPPVRRGSGSFETEATVALTRRHLTPSIPPPPAVPKLAGLHNKLAGMMRRTDPSTPAPVSLRKGERRHLTIAMVGLELVEPRESSLGAEEVEQIIDQVSSLLARHFESAGARVDRSPGESLMAVFGYRTAREDDAERAVTAAIAALDQRHEVNTALADIGYALNVRIGIHTGFVTRGGDESLTGESINLAEMVQRQAPLNALVVSRETLDLLGGRFNERHFGPISLKGRARPVEAYEIIGHAEAEGTRWSRSGVPEDRPFVGRFPELATLLGLYDDAREQGGVHLGIITGGPGLGKSRLVHELCRRLDADDERRSMVVRAHPASAAPYGAWVALLRRIFFPGGGTMLDALQTTNELGALAGALEDGRKSELIARAPIVDFLLGMGGHDLDDNHGPEAFQSRVQQTLALLLEALARRAQDLRGGRPLVAVLDDMHRADAVSLEVLGRVLGAYRAPCPLVFLITSRDGELPPLPESIAVTRVSLGPLADDEIQAIASRLCGEDPSPDVVRLLIARAAGNPLFAEEMALSLREQGMLAADAAALRRFAVPSSLVGMILARLDRLEPELRTTLQYASVLGVEFSASLFDEVTAALRDERASQRHLHELVRRGVLSHRKERGEETFAFRQVLSREAIYGTVLMDNKRVLHQLAAAAIERLHKDQLAPHLSALFHHYSQTDEIAQIVRYGRLFGRRAVALGAFADAVEALLTAETFRTRLSYDEPLAAARSLFDLAIALFWLGRFDQAGDRVEQSLNLLEGDEREEALTASARCHQLRAETAYQRAQWSEAASRLERAEELFRRAGRPFDAAQAMCTRGFQLRTQGRLEEGLALARKGWETLRDSDDLPAVVRAGHDLGNLLRDVGRYAAALEVFERAIEAGEELALQGDPLAAVWGQVAARSGRAMTFAAMGRLDEAIADQKAVHAVALREGNVLAQAYSGFHLAHHLREKGALQEAEVHATRALELCADLGLTSRAIKCHLLLGDLAERAGRATTALDHFEEAERLSRRSAVEIWLDAVERLVAVLRAQGRTDRVAALLAEAEARAGQNGDPAFGKRVSSLVATS
ncbi:serine/threonine-protein kinase PknK [Polyangium aurulentum]|uniref:serine/threonine-protein kinase n=1 Tax=Polyangium aurulentum TaxID=2567896 RepID=UPI0010AE53CB|nr:serine/threonine-protein kinase [Polyangium aurulentum]UQA57820.1 AAA family ATPase [Polyangium aurulentum]